MAKRKGQETIAVPQGTDPAIFMDQFAQQFALAGQKGGGAIPKRLRVDRQQSGHGQTILALHLQGAINPEQKRMLSQFRPQ